jgi:predicted metal-dependent peptidase
MSTKSKLTAEQRIELVHVSLMRSKEFALFAGLFMVGSVEVIDAPITACTNGRDVKYGREFIGQLTDKELAFLVLHENMHKCYRHLTTWSKLYEIDRECANMACDYVINIQLCDLDQYGNFISFPIDKQTGERMGLVDAKYRGWDAKQVFDDLMQKVSKPPPRGRDGGNGGDGADGDGKGRHGVDNSNGTPSFDEHDWENAKEMTEKEKEELAKEIDSALRQGSIYAGKVGANVPREIGELLAPKIDWRAVLRRFVKTHLKDRDAPSWRKAHRNYLWQDVILPSIIGKRVKHLVIAMDASGSVAGQLLNMFLAELNKIVVDTRAERVDVLYWDTSICGHETYKSTDNKSIVHRTNPRGGGGTNPDCVADFLREKKFKPDALVVLTDGYMHSTPENWRHIGFPSLWCVIGNDSYKPPHGQLLLIKDES